MLDSQEQKFWTTSAKATAYARDLTNTRGSVATPDYMEEEVRKEIEEIDKKCQEMEGKNGKEEDHMGLN